MQRMLEVQWKLSLCLVFFLSGCSSFLPASGPSRRAVEAKPTANTVSTGITVLDVDTNLANHLAALVKKRSFAALEGDCRNGGQRIGPGDVLAITIWETPPAALFNTAMAQASGAGSIQSNTGPSSLPDQQVNADGTITVPFAGMLRVAGMTLNNIEKLIYERLKGKTNNPQVLVRLVNNVSSTVTVVGEVQASRTVPLTPKCERLLDVLAAAGGVKQAVGKLTVQLTRKDKVYKVPLDTVIRDPQENISAQAGDVVTVLYQPLSFTALGATDKNAEIEFEETGITLAQALARAGGLLGGQADAQGVFVFRFEPLESQVWPTPPVFVTPDKTVPVVYKIDLRKPETFFATRTFPIRNGDILYVATAPSVQIQKFLQLLGSLTSPAFSTTSNVRTLTR